MSIENTPNVENKDEIEANKSVEPAKSFEEPVEHPEERTPEQVVAYETHQKLLAQRKADQKKARELEEKLKEMQEAAKRREDEELEKQQEYKKLYENSKAELEAVRQEKAERDRIMVEKEKRIALAKELGGIKKEEYFKFADLKNIVIGDDGQIDTTSVRYEANRFRQAYPELLNSQPSVRINNQAPSNDGMAPKEGKAADKMSKNERERFKREQLMKSVRK